MTSPLDPNPGHALGPVLLERLGRLKAEADLAALRAEVARERFRIRRTNDPANTGGGTLVVGGIVAT